MEITKQELPQRPSVASEIEETTALIDRRVRVIAGGGVGEEVRISSLREQPRYVLLGEPGSGKSTVLDGEAKASGESMMTVRDFLRGPKPSPGARLYLDALDEYRSEGSSSDRIDMLASAIFGAKAARWRISCRAEDWRLDADLAGLQPRPGEEPVCVVQLLPLNAEEALQLLAHYGCAMPEEFLAQAERLGAHGFAENPFSLKLLNHATLDGKIWPSTRYELFSRAIAQLAYEHDPLRQRLVRNASQVIIHAAGRINLFLLVTGAQSVWVSNNVPPQEDCGRYLNVEDTGLPASVVTDTLDTALFRGDGVIFVPMHRTIAEFSAAQYLCEAIAGGEGAAALPLSRVLAVITAADGAPPTELRGLFGWFVTQLSHRRWSHEVQSLVAADPVTALHYGDPAKFSTDEKRYLLRRLPAHAPHHGWPEGISLGGLASEELIPDFRHILLHEDAESDLVLTVVEVLERGLPLRKLHAFYGALVLDAGKPLWFRKRMFNLCVESASNTVRVPRRYFEALRREGESETRVMLQLHIAEGMTGDLTTPEIKVLLHDFERLPFGNTVGELYPFHRALLANVPVDLFETPVNSWRAEDADSMRADSLDQDLDELLASLILNGPPRAAEQIWRWAQNWRRVPYGPYGPAVVAAIAQRYGQDPVWRAALLEAAYTLGRAEWPFVHHDYRALASDVDELALSVVWEKLVSSPHNENLLAALVYSVRRFDWPELYWHCYTLLKQRPEQELFQVLTSSPLRLGGRVPRKIEDTSSVDHTKWLENMEQACDSLTVGGEKALLDWGANVYLNPRNDCPRLERLKAQSNERIAMAMLAGFRRAAIDFALAPDALNKLLGRADYTLPVLAGVVTLLDEEDPTFAPDLSLAVMVFCTRASEIINYRQRNKLEQWAIRQLNDSSATAANYLTTLWSLHLAAGATRLPGLPLSPSDQATGAGIGKALANVLRSNLGMPASALAAIWQSIALCLPAAEIAELVAVALPNVPEGPNRLIWRLAEMCLDPVGLAEGILRDFADCDFLKYMDGSNSEGFGERLLTNDPHAASYYYALMVCIAGPRVMPNVYQDGRTMMVNAGSYAVKRAIRRLASNPVAEAGYALQAFSIDPSLAAWRSEFLTAVLLQAARQRDEGFAYTSPSQLDRMLKNGPPLNAADLYAVLSTELTRLRDELRTDDLSPWAQFWNFSGGKISQPRIENLCRDHLLARLRDRLKPYLITAAMPEAQHAGSTRADMLVISGANARVPVEIKRHMHPDVWIAAGTQLQHYVAHLDADGMGIYVVLWFGREHGRLPARPGKGKLTMPTTPEQFQKCLVEDLPERLRGKTQIFVFDVSPLRRTN